MRFFLYDMEKLYNRSCNGNHGNIVPQLIDTQALFVHSIYGHRFITYSFEHSIPEDPLKSAEKKHLKTRPTLFFRIFA